jgi:hypothetical protein
MRVFPAKVQEALIARGGGCSERSKGFADVFGRLKYLIGFGGNQGALQAFQIAQSQHSAVYHLHV